MISGVGADPSAEAAAGGWRRWASAVGLWLALYGLVLAVYSKALRAGLIYDDVAMLLYFNDASDFHWYDSFRPMLNGFVRPVYMFVCWVSAELAGFNPVGFRLHSAAVHVTVAVAAGLTSCRIFGFSRMAGAAVSLTVALASAAFVTVYYWSSMGDSYLALGVLAVVYFCHRWLTEGQARWLGGMAAGVALAVASKETGIAVAGVVVLLVWVSGRRDWRAWGVAGAVMVICGAWGAAAMMIQAEHDHSYYRSGYGARGITEVGERVFRYLGATVLPGTFVLKPLWRWDEQMAQLINLLVRGAALIIVLSATAAVARGRGRGGMVYSAVLVLSAAGMLLPTAGVALEAGPHSPIGRYLYTSLVLVVMAGGGVAAWLYRTHRVWWRMASVAWMAWLVAQVIVIRKSPGTAEYYETSREWTALRKEMARLSPEWPVLRAVSVYSGPQYGSFFLDENYGTALMRVYFPRLLMGFVSNRVVPETGCCYVFDGRKLSEVK